MAIPANPSTAPAHEDVLHARGALVAAAELERHPSTYQPPDHVWVFRDDDAWALLTLSRTERWDGDGVQERHRCHARIVSVTLASIGDLGDRIRGSYGESGWHGVLDAGSTDPDLFRAWAPVAIERELEAARFFREELVPCIDDLISLEVGDLRIDAEHRLRVAGFRVLCIGPQRRPTQPGENFVVAEAVVRKYGLEVDVIVRMDRAGEVYFRVSDESDARRQVIGEIEDGDG